MKKNFKYAILSAIALVGAVSFSACQSSDDLGDVNPTYDGESVKTSFTISIGDVKGTPTRMLADEVQSDELFNGMTDIYLFPFISSTALSTISVTSESYIHLADFAAFDAAVETAQGKIYKDVNLSVGVNKFVFYGATASGSKGDGELKASYLKMDKKDAWTSDWAPSPILTTSTLNDIKFDLVPIQRGKSITDVQTAGSTITSVLNGIDTELSTQIGSASGDALTELQKIQKTLRNDISATTTPEYKAYAGSSKSIGNLISMLYGTVKNLESKIGATATTAIVGKLSAFTLSGDGSASSPYKAVWATDPNFPGSLGVPDGAVAVKFASGSFSFVEPSVDGMSAPSIDNYTYPARLYYRANTTSMIKNTEYLSTLANSQTTWDAIKTNGAYTEAAVKSDTRSVIMKDQVQYAVGRLDVQVRVKPSATIVDNSKDAEQPVSVPGGGYKLTGVLIGGQKQVDWEFLPVGATEMIIWDNKMASEIYAKQQEDYSSANYTLALETAPATAGDATSGAVNIALEFENTGNDFCGVDHNVIPAGTKFYLVAKLVPSSATQPTGETLNQVFKQDYITTAKLTISETSLKNAYNVVPDLRSPKLEFGLSVDLKWRPGLTFTMEF